MDCCIFKFLWRSVNGKHLIRFQSEASVFKFVERGVYKAFSLQCFNRVFISREDFYVH